MSMQNPSTSSSPRSRQGRGGGGGGPKPEQRAAAEYSTRALESVKDQLALHQMVVDDANDRVRAIEHERSHLTADYTARVERLQTELAVSSQRLMQTKMTIQARTDELSAATDRARALVEECVMIKQEALTEAASIMRAQQDYAMREQELDNVIAERTREVGDLEEALENERGEARALKRQLVDKLAYLNKLRAPKARDASPVKAGAAGAGAEEERYFFRLELQDLLAAFTAEHASQQLVQLQKTFEIEAERVRQTFLHYCFDGPVNPDDPFSMSTEQFKRLLADASIVLDSVSLTKCFLNLPIAKLDAVESGEDSGRIDLDTFVEVIVRVAFIAYDPTVKKSSNRLDKAAVKARQQECATLQTQKKSSDLVSNLDQLLKSNFKLAKKTKPDKVFLEAYNCIEGHAALKPHTAKIKELFTRALEHFPEAPVADAAAPAEQEPAMSVRQWRLFCEWQDVVGDDDRRLSMNTVMLAFVQVYARRLGQSTFDEEAMDLPSALAVAKGDVKKPPRAQPRLTLHAFEDAVATLAWAHARQLGAVKGLPLSEKFNAFAALLSAHKPLPR